MRAASAVSAGNEIKFMKGSKEKKDGEKFTKIVIEFAKKKEDIHIERQF